MEISSKNNIGLPTGSQVLMISTDSKILETHSSVRQRLIEYAKNFRELHVIVYAKKLGLGNWKLEINSNFFIYPTNSLFKIQRIFGGYKLGKKIIRNWKSEIGNFFITTQDPFETGWLGYFLSKQFKNSKLQIQLHTDFLSPYFKKESLKNKLRIRVGKFTLKRADLIRVVSERIKRSLKSINIPESKIQVLPIFSDIEKLKQTPVKIDLHKKYPEYKQIILMASRLTQEKNISLAISAMPEVIKKHPKTLLLIVGSGPEQKKLESSIQAQELSKNIIIEPWTDDLASYYKTADLFLLTSNYEGYGLTIIEALACNLPVIMSDVGVAGEVNVTIFPVGDKEQLISKILEFLDNDH